MGSGGSFGYRTKKFIAGNTKNFPYLILDGRGQEPLFYTEF